MIWSHFLKEFQKFPVKSIVSNVNSCPKVSVCVVTYQHEKFIANCLEGILMQRCNFPFEVIVGEDGSEDATRSICKKYAEEHKNLIRLYLHDRRNNINIKGFATGRFNLLYSIFQSRGKYIATCEGDDYWTDPYKLQKQVDFLELNNDCSLVYHGFQNIFSDCTVSNSAYFEPINETIYSSRFSTLMFRKKAVRDIPRSILHAINGDQALKFHLSTKGYFKCLKTIKPSVRKVHSGGVMSMQTKKIRLERALQTWEAIYMANKRRENKNKLFFKVKGFRSSLKWLEYEEHKSIKLFWTSLRYDFKSGAFIKRFQVSLKNLFFKPLVYLKRRFLEN